MHVRSQNPTRQCAVSSSLQIMSSTRPMCHLRIFGQGCGIRPHQKPKKWGFYLVTK
jgi:hypothetical protein